MTQFAPRSATLKIPKNPQTRRIPEVALNQPKAIIINKMKAYWYDNLPGDQREPHDSGREVSPSYLSKLGILHFHYPNLEDVNTLAADRSYKNRDEVTISPQAMGDVYEEKVKNFFHEHLHEDEEIRYILDGAGYFDCRNEGDEWIRIRLEKNDLMIMPAGIYHRFTTDDQNYTKAMRLFKEDPKWTPLNRGDETEKNRYRQEYIKAYGHAPVASN